MKDLDLTDIKDDDMDKTASFTDLMTRSERKAREKEKKNQIKLKDSLNEKIEKINKTVNVVDDEEEKLEKTLINQEKINEENLLKTQVLELTKKMELNLKENIKEEKKIKGTSPITDIGIFILIALAYFIYSLLFTNYLDNELFLLIDGAIILFMFLLFGITILTTKRNNKPLAIINFIVLILFLVFNILTTTGIIK